MDRFGVDSGNEERQPARLLRRLIDHARGRQSLRGEELNGLRRWVDDHAPRNETEGEPVAIIGRASTQLCWLEVEYEPAK